MKYTSKTFTLPVCGKSMTEEEYAVAVGKRECAMVRPPTRTAVLPKPEPKKKDEE